MLTNAEARIAIPFILYYPRGAGSSWFARMKASPGYYGSPLTGLTGVSKKAIDLVRKHPALQSIGLASPQAAVALARGSWSPQDWEAAREDLLLAIWGDAYRQVGKTDRKILQHGYERLLNESPDTLVILLRSFLQRVEQEIAHDGDPFEEEEDALHGSTCAL